MKNIQLIIFVFIGFFVKAQNIDVSTGFKSEGLSTIELNALPLEIKDGLVIKDTTINKIVAWNGSQFIEVGGGSSGGTYIFSTGLTESSGTVTVTNPFEAADESKLDGIATGATVGADWDTNLTNIPASLDLDGSGTAVTAGTNVTVTGTGTAASPYVINSTASGTGDVTGPASATDNAIARFDGVTGKLIQGSGVTIDDANIISGLNVVNAVGFIASSNVVVGGTGFLRLNAHDSEPPGTTEGVMYWDNSENRMKGYDGTSWKTFLMNGDAAGTDSQTLSLGGAGNTQLSISGGNTVDLSGLGGTGDALTTNPLSQFAATTSAQLAGVLSDESGSGGGFVRSSGASLTGPTITDYFRANDATSGYWDLAIDPITSPTDFDAGDFAIAYEDGGGTGFEQGFVFRKDGSFSINGRRIRNNAGQLQYQNASGTYEDFGSGTGGTDDQTASEVPFTPNGSIAATNVQAAIQEVRDEAGTNTDDQQLSLSGTTLTLEDGGTPIDLNATFATDAELAGASGTDSGQTKVYELGTSKTLALADFLDGGSLTGRAKVIYHTANDTIILGTGLGQTGRMVTAMHQLAGADSIYIKKGAGATVINRQLAYNASGISEDGLWATRDVFIDILPDGKFQVTSDATLVAHTESVADPMAHATLAIRLDDTSIDATATTEGDPVGLWTDIVSGHNATSAGANRPSLHIVGGQRTVSFDGTDDFLEIAAANVDYQNGDEVTFMIELADIVPDNNVGTQYILSKAGFNSTTNHQYTIWSVSNLTRFNAYGNQGTTSTDYAANQVLTLKVKATTFDAFINGTKVVTDQPLTNSATFAVNLILGGNNAGIDNNATVSMQGVYIYESALSDTEITDRVTYLNAN